MNSQVSISNVTPCASGTTGGNGRANFSDLAPGSYDVFIGSNPRPKVMTVGSDGRLSFRAMQDEKGNVSATR